MLNFVSIFVALIILGVVVTIHEFGHFIVGKLSGIAVTEFAVGMGPKLISWQGKETKYSIRLLPLGGFCAFVGEDEDNPDPRAMNNQPVWKRFLTVFAGPFMNFLLAFIMAVVLIAGSGIPNPYSVVTVPVLYSVDENMPAGRAGLQAGDVIVKVDGEEIAPNDEGVEMLRKCIAETEGENALTLTVKRNGEEMEVSLAPEFSEEEGRLLIGIVFSAQYEEYDCNVITAVPEAMTLLGKTVINTVAFLKDMISGLLRGSGIEQGSVSGVVGIVSSVSTDVQASFSYGFATGVYSIMFWLLNISLSLGIMNLLPIPALDGGRLVFLTVEGIRRKPLNREKEAIVNLIGFALLILLMIVVTVSDVRGLLK